MNKTVLITGGTGLTGKPLTEKLLEKGYTVHHLSRNAKAQTPGVKTFLWDVHSGRINPACIENVTSVIHLAGEGIASRPWTKKQKKELIESRTKSIRLIYDLIRKSPASTVREVVSASGVGIYGNRGDELLSEHSSTGNDFLTQICIEWENAVNEIAPSGLRIMKFRTGVVLSPNGGALAQMDKPVKAGFGAVLGSGKQWMPWIHIDDIVRLYLFALENETLSGEYNAAAPQPVTNKSFTKSLATVLNKKIWLPHVPATLLRIILGEMCAVVLNSTNTTSEKILNAGFSFNFEQTEDALTDIYARQTAH